MHGVKDVGQTEIHTAEPIVPDPSASEFQLAIDKLKSHKSPGADQIPENGTFTGVSYKEGNKRNRNAYQM